MKKLLFYAVGYAWAITGLVAMNYIGAALDTDIELILTLGCFVKAGIWGSISFALLAVLTNLAWGMDI